MIEIKMQGRIYHISYPDADGCVLYHAERYVNNFDTVKQAIQYVLDWWNIR